MSKKILNAIPEFLSRVSIGIVFIGSGWGKFHDLSKVVSYFDSLGIPFANLQAPFVAGVELLAGVMILLGFMTRYASVVLIVIMLVALKTAKAEEITDVSSIFGLTEFLYIVILTWLASVGAKLLSVDQVLLNCCNGKSCHKE